MSRVIGVDSCKKGWIGITSDLHGYFGTSIEQLVAAADSDGVLDVVAIDIPIGLPRAGPRQADVLARSLVGKRKSSVFPTPIRAAILAATHAEATALTTEATGKGLSQQAYALGKKILEVDAWVRSIDRRVIEVHPEVCFATMSGGSLTHSKKTWAGAEERRGILSAVGIEIPADIGSAGKFAAVDDVLDAVAASWTAARYADGDAVSHPAVPERFDEGPAAAIWV